MVKQASWGRDSVNMASDMHLEERHSTSQPYIQIRFLQKRIQCRAVSVVNPLVS